MSATALPLFVPRHRASAPDHPRVTVTETQRRNFFHPTAVSVALHALVVALLVLWASWHLPSPAENPSEMLEMVWVQASAPSPGGSGSESVPDLNEAPAIPESPSPIEPPAETAITPPPPMPAAQRSLTAPPTAEPVADVVPSPPVADAPPPEAVPSPPAPATTPAAAPALPAIPQMVPAIRRPAPVPTPAVTRAPRPRTQPDRRPNGQAPAAPATESGPGPESQPGAVDAVPPVVTSARYRLPPLPPTYPPRAIDMGWTGSVVLRALVAATGETRQVLVHRSSGFAILDTAALAAVRAWAFEPAAVGGRRIEAWVEVPVHFRLN